MHGSSSPFRVMHANRQLAVADAVLGDAVEFVDHEDISISYSVEESGESFIGVCVGQHCRRLLTCGDDGACAIHAVFGNPEDGRLRHPRPRVLLRCLLDEDLALIKCKVRASQQLLLDAILTALWTDFVIPYSVPGAAARPNEEAMFLHRLENSALWPSICQCLADRGELTRKSEDLKLQSRTRSASIFLPELEQCLWSPLAIRGGLMPSGASLQQRENENSNKHTRMHTASIGQ